MPDLQGSRWHHRDVAAKAGEGKGVPPASTCISILLMTFAPLSALRSTL